MAWWPFSDKPTYQALGSSRDRFWRGAKRGYHGPEPGTDIRPSNRWRSMRTNVRNALSYAERWPPGGTKPQWPGNFRKFMGWIFLATSLHYLRVSIENFPYAIRQQGPILLIRILLIAPVFSTVVSVISGLAWWTVWKGKSSARGWAIAASLVCVMAFARQFIIPLRPVWDWELTWLWIGIVGLVAFSWPNWQRHSS